MARSKIINILVAVFVICCTVVYAQGPVKYFRYCYNFEYPILMELYGQLKDKASIGHCYKVIYSANGKNNRIESVEHLFNGKPCPIINNDKLIVDFSWPYYIKNHNSQVVKVKFEYDSEERITKICFTDIHDKVCNNSIFKSSFKYEYNLKKPDSAKETQYFCIDDQEQKCPLNMLNNYDLFIQYSPYKKGEVRRIMQIFIPGISDLMHSYIYHNSGLISKKTMDFRFNDRSVKVNANEYYSIYDSKINNLKGIQKIELEIDTNGITTKISKFDIDGKPYGTNAIIKSTISKNKGEFVINRSFFNGNDKRIEHVDGQYEEIVTLNSDFFLKSKVYIDSLGNINRNSFGIAKITYEYNEKDTSLTIIRYGNAKEDLIDYNSKVIVPYEQFFYDNLGRVIRQNRKKDKTKYIESVNSIVPCTKTYYTKTYDGLIITSEYLKNDLPGEKEYINYEYSSIIDSLILQANGLEKCSSYIYDAVDLSKNYVYKSIYDTCGRSISYQTFRGNEKISDLEIIHPEYTKFDNYEVIYKSKLDTVKTIYTFSTYHELLKYEFSNLAKGNVIETYEGSNIRGYSYKYDSKGRIKNSETILYDEEENKTILLSILAEKKYSKDYLSEYDTLEYYLRKKLKSNPEKIITLQKYTNPYEYVNFHKEEITFDKWSNETKKLTYDEKNVQLEDQEKIKTFDQTGNISSIITTYQNGESSKESFEDYTFNKKPRKKITQDGITYFYQYDINGNTIEEKKRNTQKCIPLAGTKNVYILKRKYDDYGKCIEKRYFDSLNKPTYSNSDSSIHCYQFIWTRINSIPYPVSTFGFEYIQGKKMLKAKPLIEANGNNIYNKRLNYNEDGKEIGFSYWTIEGENNKYKQEDDPIVGIEETKLIKTVDENKIHEYKLHYDDSLFNEIPDSMSFWGKENELVTNENDPCKCAGYKYGFRLNKATYEYDTISWSYYNPNKKLFLPHSPETEAMIIKTNNESNPKMYYKEFFGLNKKSMTDKYGVSGWEITTFETDGNRHELIVNINNRKKEIVNKEGFSKKWILYNSSNEPQTILKFNKSKLIEPIEVFSNQFKFDGNKIVEIKK